MADLSFPVGTKPNIIEAPEAIGGPSWAAFALTCEWPDGEETTELVSERVARAIGYGIEGAVVTLDDAALAPDAQAGAVEDELWAEWERLRDGYGVARGAQEVAKAWYGRNMLEEDAIASRLQAEIDAFVRRRLAASGAAPAGGLPGVDALVECVEKVLRRSSMGSGRCRMIPATMLNDLRERTDDVLASLAAAGPGDAGRDDVENLDSENKWLMGLLEGRDAFIVQHGLWQDFVETLSPNAPTFAPTPPATPATAPAQAPAATGLSPREIAQEIVLSVVGDPDRVHVFAKWRPDIDRAEGLIRDAIAAATDGCGVTDGWSFDMEAARDGRDLDLWIEEEDDPGYRRTNLHWGRPQHTCGEMGGLCDSCPPDGTGWLNELEQFAFEEGEAQAVVAWRIAPAPPTNAMEA